MNLSRIRIVVSSACVLLTAAASVVAGADVPDTEASAIKNSQHENSNSINQPRELSFAAFRGCVQDEAYTIPEGDECYAVDSSVCSFLYNRDCREVTARYDYYNGGRIRGGAEPFEEALYHKVAISATRGCNRANRCTIAVDGVACTSCTNSGPQYRLVTMADCSNLENNPFATTDEPQTILLGSGGGHFQLEEVQQQCNHPALANLPEPGSNVLSIEPHQFQYSLSSDTGELVTPETPEISVLVADTSTYFAEVLTGIFPDVTGFRISIGWQSRYNGGGDVNRVTGNLFLDCKLLVSLQEPLPGDTPTTAVDVTNFLAIPSVMNAYLRTTVRTSHPVFLPTDTVVSRVLEE